MNRKPTTGFPMSYGWSAYVNPKFPKGWLKKRFFKNEIQFQSNKVCYKVSLCENFPRSLSAVAELFVIYVDDLLWYYIIL